jgi:hypothetical protein
MNKFAKQEGKLVFDYCCLEEEKNRKELSFESQKSKEKKEKVNRSYEKSGERGKMHGEKNERERPPTAPPGGGERVVGGVIHSQSHHSHEREREKGRHDRNEPPPTVLSKPRYVPNKTSQILKKVDDECNIIH